ncbi:MAG TPA: flagellar basal body rod protein FlgB [Deltaproteobacteria bacterium]|jgi:flagellar basal-body rod protein FlgB|nr:flagellar basal body rod protein FlgB [Deltaproteobacteria bacterium]HQI01811.1 flagellar basal body rod protein FlgB [Deltaproteobacteria bacterium]HQJ08384.1 flagellar basal body rod protein FlgB [Deltaproteobacteria bacterium]
MAGLFGKEISELASVMNFRLFRQGIISSNIANIDTPGYKSKEATFEEELDTRLTMNTTSPEHLPSAGQAQSLTFKVAEDPFARIGNDSNTVDLDREMMKLSQNQLLYDASADAIQMKITALKEAIRGIR